MASTFDAWLRRRASERDRLGLTRRLHDADRGDPLLDLAGNDYLGLARHPLVIESAVAAARRFGAGAGASRLVSGTLSVHTELEDELAGFLGFEAALVCSTGYHANLATVQAVVDANTLVVSDAHVHASMIDAVRLARASVTVVAHNDLDGFRAALATRSQQRAVVLIETIYSVLGDQAPVVALASLCEEFDAILVADEAHAIGVVGPGGRGVLARSGLTDRRNVIATGTLSKSLGAQGGVVLGSRAVREHLVNHARPFIYDTALAPPAAGAARAALAILESSPDLPTRARKNAAALADACRVYAPAGAVLSVSMPGPTEALAAVASAAAAGVRIGCFRPPSTPDGVSRLRLTAHAHHTSAEIAVAVQVLEQLTHERLSLLGQPA
ncbi:MAG: 8-amino-7-oxononanoate synthase [Marmoricola sp.]|nr:8-amino-7-oxononanoate synthase [Marmoricola sp.]